MTRLMNRPVAVHQYDPDTGERIATLYEPPPDPLEWSYVPNGMHNVVWTAKTREFYYDVHRILDGGFKYRLDIYYRQEGLVEQAVYQSVGRAKYAAEQYHQESHNGPTKS